MPEMTYGEALIDALCIALRRDSSFEVIGRGICGHGPDAAAEARLADFGDRITDPPTSEAVVAMIGLGSSMVGLRNFVHFGTAVFAFEAWNQIVNEAAVARYMSGGRLKTPVVFHMFHGLRGGGGPQHSASPHAAYAGNPGLDVVLPSSPADVKGLLLSAIHGDKACVFLSHPALMSVRGDVAEGYYETPLGKASIRRPGADLTVVALSHQVVEALTAAQMLAAEGIDVEVVDPRTIAPFDEATILASVAKTGRLVVADEGSLAFGFASEVAALVAEKGFASLKAPVVRVARPELPVGFSPPLEAHLRVDAAKIAAAVRRVMGR